MLEPNENENHATNHDDFSEIATADVIGFLKSLGVSDAEIEKMMYTIY